MLSGIHRCNGIIETFLLFYTHPFGANHVATWLHDFNVCHRDYDKKYSCRKHPFMLLGRTLSVYDAGVDSRADLVDSVVGWQRKWISEEAGRRARLCGRAYYRCQSFLALSVRATVRCSI